MSPIELACESLSGRASTIEQETKTAGPQLQQILAGSVSAAVNAGPLEYLNLFLRHPQDFEEKLVNQLVVAFKRFLQACNEGLKKERQRVGNSMLQEHMESDLKKLEAEILPFLVGKLNKSKDEE